MTASEKRLHRLLKHDLGNAVSRSEWGTWTTTSNLPHEIRLHAQSGLELVRVSAGMVIGAKATKRLFEDINWLNAERAFSRRILGEDKVIVVAEMPLASVRAGDLEQLVSMIMCTARLDAPMLAKHGGRSVTDPPPALAPDLEMPLHSWWDVLRASGTATARELGVWLDDVANCDCWIDHDDGSVTVVMRRRGIGNVFPCTLQEIIDLARELEEPDDDEDW